MTTTVVMGEPRVAEAAPSHLGKIRFAMDIWEAALAEGVDFPFILSQLGFVPYAMDPIDVRSRGVLVTYRWFGFPSLGVGDIPEYRVSVTMRDVAEGGRTYRDIFEINFTTPSSSCIRCLRIDNTWIVNPNEEEIRRVHHVPPEAGLALSMLPTEGARHEVPVRRIVVNRE